MFHVRQSMRSSRGCALGACALLVALIGACAATPSPDGGDDPNPDDGTVSPTGAELATLILQTDPFAQWAQFSDRAGTLPSAPPHGPMSNVFINSVVESALDDFSGQLPDGSIIVKENVGTSPDVTEAALTVMWKVAGFDPAGNDWFWANLTTSGEIVVEGKVAACAACHGGARDNDFVFVHQF